MLTVGIDPGRKGGIALLWPDGKALLQDIPYDDAGLDVHLMYGAALLWKKGTRVVIEQVGGAVQDGASNAFSFGWNTGAMVAAIMLAGHAPQFVHPARWKVRMGLKGKPKKASLLLAREIYPEVKGLERMKDEGRAEALLIAHFAMHGGQGYV